MPARSATGAPSRAPVVFSHPVRVNEIHGNRPVALYPWKDELVN